MKTNQKIDGQYGVENIKNAFALVANFGEGVYQIVDNGTNTGELISVGSNFILKSMGKIPKLGQLPLEYKDMSVAEREEVNQDFAKELELPNSPKIEAIAEKAQTVINLLLDLGFDIAQTRKEVA